MVVGVSRPSVDCCSASWEAMKGRRCSWGGKWCLRPPLLRDGFFYLDNLLHSTFKPPTISTNVPINSVRTEESSWIYNHVHWAQV